MTLVHLAGMSALCTLQLPNLITTCIYYYFVFIVLQWVTVLHLLMCGQLINLDEMLGLVTSTTHYISLKLFKVAKCQGWHSGLAVERWTSIIRSWVRFSLGARLRINLGQVVHTYVLPSLSIITWYWSKDSDVLQLQRWLQAWRKVMAAYYRGMT